MAADVRTAAEIVEIAADVAEDGTDVAAAADAGVTDVAGTAVEDMEGADTRTFHNDNQVCSDLKRRREKRPRKIRGPFLFRRG